jgi:hypothetical protein
MISRNTISNQAMYQQNRSIISEDYLRLTNILTYRDMPDLFTKLSDEERSTRNISKIIYFDVPRVRVAIHERGVASFKESEKDRVSLEIDLYELDVLQKIRKLEETIEKSDLINPDTFKLKVRREEERDELIKLIKALESKLNSVRGSKYEDLYREAWRNANLSLTEYWEEWSKQKIIENSKKRKNSLLSQIKD